MTELGYAPGTVYPLLFNLTQKGLLRGTWEAESPTNLGRPPKQFYALTQQGHAKTDEELIKMRRLIAKLDT